MTSHDPWQAFLKAEERRRATLIGYGWPDGEPLPIRRRKSCKTGKIRRKKWEADPRCHYCERELTWLQSTLDHVIPRCRGGKNTEDNTVLSCADCNQKKGARIMGGAAS